MSLWEPPIHDRFDLAHGIVFLVTCGPEFNRKIGSRVKLDGAVWEVLSWDDHKTTGAPHDGEHILLRVRRVTLGDESESRHARFERRGDRFEDIAEKEGRGRG